MYTVLDSKNCKIWQYSQVEDAVSKMGEITTIDDPLWLIQSTLELRERYAIIYGDHWVEIFHK